MPREVPKFIESRFGTMFIIEHHPDGPTPDTWVVSLNSGLQNRTGPRRIYLQLARRLTEAGVGVVRVDLPGVGDSDGPPPATHFDCYDPKDVAQVLAYLREEYDSPQILLHGLCAGSRVAIKAAANDPDIVGVLAWSTTIYTPTPGSTRPPEEPKHGVSNAMAAYNSQRATNFLREMKFFSFRFWKNYLTSGKVMADLRSFFWSGALLLKGKNQEQMLTSFIESLNSYVDSGRPIHFVYGDRDQPCFGEFQDLELDIPESSVLVIKDGTHTFSTYSQREEAINGTKSWFNRSFDPESGDRAVAAPGL